MNIPKMTAVAGVFLVALLGWALSRSQAQSPSAVQHAGKPMKAITSFAWRDGILIKRGDKWFLRSNNIQGIESPAEIQAFPWLAFGVQPSATNEITPFPRYPRDKYERDGHHYPVNTKAHWFGAVCRDVQEYEEYSALMLTIQGQIGEDPPSQKPVFEGAGFYIVTAY